MRTSRLVQSNALLLLLAIGLLIPGRASAQTGAGSLTGIVGDQSGATVPGAAVTATNQATNVIKTATTPPIQVEALQTVRVDFKMELGLLEETVVGVGTSPLLQTETATVGEVISGTTVERMPLNGRNSGARSLLLEGVAKVAGSGAALPLEATGWLGEVRAALATLTAGGRRAVLPRWPRPRPDEGG